MRTVKEPETQSDLGRGVERGFGIVIGGLVALVAAPILIPFSLLRAIFMLFAKAIRESRRSRQEEKRYPWEGPGDE